MPTLNWIGKEAVVDHHRHVPTRLLECDPELSAGDPDAENLLVEGDNLEALFPDFIVELKDGSVVLVEYKMGKMASDPEEQHKKAVGDLWASRSEGRCRFAWIVDRDWRTLNASLQG